MSHHQAHPVLINSYPNNYKSWNILALLMCLSTAEYYVVYKVIYCLILSQNFALKDAEYQHQKPLKILGLKYQDAINSHKSL